MLGADVEHGDGAWRGTSATTLRPRFRREHDRKRPLKALGDVSRRVSHRIVRMGIDGALLPSLPIEPREVPAVAARIDNIRVARIAVDVIASAAAARV